MNADTWWQIAMFLAGTYVGVQAHYLFSGAGRPLREMRAERDAMRAERDEASAELDSVLTSAINEVDAATQCVNRMAEALHEAREARDRWEMDAERWQHFAAALLTRIDELEEANAIRSKWGDA